MIPMKMNEGVENNEIELEVDVKIRKSPKNLRFAEMSESSTFQDLFDRLMRGKSPKHCTCFFRVPFQTSPPK